LQDSASSLVAANNSYEEAVALIAAANRVVQDPNSVGAALRTISLRLRSTSTQELEEAGEDTDGVITSKSKLQSKVKGLTGVDILTDSGAYRSTYDILLDISRVWKEMSDVDQAALLEILAGKTRSNTAAAILSNTKDLEKAYEAALNAEGSALQENEKYLDSIQGRIDIFNNSVQTMWSNTLDSDVIKFLVDVGTQFIKWIDDLGLIKSLIMGIGTFVIQKHFKGDLFGGLFGDSTSIDAIKKQITLLEKTYTKAKEKFETSPSDNTRVAMENAEKNLNIFKESNKPMLDLDEQKNTLNEQLEKLKSEREKLQGDLKIAQDNFVDITTNGVQDDIKEFIDIDTSHIDGQIEDVQNKLMIAKQELSEMPKGKDGWNYYKSMGSMTPAKDRDARIDAKKNEIKELEGQLNNLQATKDEFMSSKIDNVVTEGAQAQVDGLTKQINEADTAIQQTELELKNVEIQANATGNAGLSAAQRFKTGFMSAAKSVGTFAKQVATSMLTMYAITTVLELFETLGHGIEKAIDGMHTSSKELQEELSNCKNELSSIESEIDSLNSELDATNEQIEELLSNDALSFVEQEELDRLRAVSSELKSQIALQETLRESKQKGVNAASVNATNAYLDTSFMSDKTKSERQEEAKETGETIGKVAGLALGALLIGAGVLGEGVTFGTSTGLIVLGASMMAGGAIGGAVGSGVEGASYDSEQSVGEAMDNMLAQREELLKAQNDALTEGDVEAYNAATEALRTYDTQMSEHISQIQQNYNAMDWELATPDERQYMKEMMDWIDQYNLSMGASGAKETAINHVFDHGEFATEKKQIDEYVEAIKNGDETASKSIEDLINNNQALKDAFSAKTLDPQDAIDYFTQIGQEANFATLDGKTKEIQKATEKLKSAFNNIGQFMKDGQVDTTIIAEYFQGTSEATRKEIARLVKNIHDGEITVAQALKSFAAYGMAESWKIIEAEVSELNTEVFKDLGEDISGVINTVQELSSAFESVAKSIDLVSQAEAEMAYSGHLSVETALQLMESTEDWNKVLEIENGNIKLLDGAEEALIQTKLDLIETNLKTALSTVEAQLAQITATESSSDLAYTIEESTNLAVTQLAGNMAYLTEMMTAYTKAAAGEAVNMAAVTKSAENAKAKVLSDTNYKKNSAEAIGREELEKEKARLEALLEMYGTVDTTNEFKNNYSSDKVSGGSGTKEDAQSNAFQDSMDYWENRIAASQARYEQVQNEIDLLEAKGKRASEGHYKKQIELEHERKTLLESQRTEAKKYLIELQNAGKKGTDEWWDAANVLNDIESELDDIVENVWGLYDTIAQLNKELSEETHSRFSDLLTDTGNVRDILSYEDMFDDEGNITEAGVATLGTHIQDIATYNASNAKIDEEMLSNGLVNSDGTLRTWDEFSAANSKHLGVIDSTIDLAKEYDGNEEYFRSYGIRSAEEYQAFTDFLAKGITSEQEFYDEMTRLTDLRDDNTKGIKESEKAVVEMYENQIDAIEEYVNKSVDSYNDYIDSVKEALDAERELYEFKKNVEKQTKNIAALERRISALSGSTAAEDIAERRKLEAELANAREDINDTYRDHAISSQQNALDEEAQAYEQAMNRYIDGLRTTLKDASADLTTFVNTVAGNVVANADTVYDQYTETGIALDSALVKPWEDLKAEIEEFEGENGALGKMNSWTEENGSFDVFANNASDDLERPFENGTEAVNSFGQSVSEAMNTMYQNIHTNVADSLAELNKLNQAVNKVKDTDANPNVQSDKNKGQKPTANQNTVSRDYAMSDAEVMALQTILNTVFKAGLKVDGIYGSGTMAAVKNAQKLIGANADGYYGQDTRLQMISYIDDIIKATKNEGLDTTKYKNAKAQLPTSYYAKGTLGTHKNELAVVDELGPELILRANPETGRLDYLTRGTSVVPADISANLIEWGKLNPHMMSLPNVTPNMNIINNAINKPEFNLSVDNFLRCDNVSHDTLPDLKQFVKTEMNSLIKQMNYAIKGKGGR
jgi:peptidoglycan hydrolase-like protein with peptidoglycan-binding domain